MKEARRNPHLNIKVSSYDALKPYSNDPNCFVSFTWIDKIGINPQSQYATPIGIYTYPLKTIWKKYKIDTYKNIGAAVPFAGEAPYIWLLKVNPDVNFVDMDDYTVQQYDRDKNKIKDFVLENKLDFPDYFSYENTPYEKRVSKAIEAWADFASTNDPIMKIWNITRNLALDRAFLNPGKKDTVQWNFLLRRVLGYDGFVDYGNEYIHPNEPYQAVFLSKSSFTVIGQFYNKAREKTSARDSWIKDAEISKASYYRENDDFIWEEGTWHGGTWKEGIWHSGIWEDGTWESGDWLKGTWEDGIWKNGHWWSGIWNWGEWYDGIWDEGTHNGGIWHGGIWKGGIWNNGNWNGGEWLGGTWIQGKIYDEEIEDYVFSEVSPKEYKTKPPSIKILKEHIEQFPHEKLEDWVKEWN